MINKAQELNVALKNLDVSKEYLSLKEKIKQDEYVNNLLEVIKSTQKQMKEYLKNNDIKNYKASQQTLEVLKQEFINYPLINNYIIIKDEMYQVLEQVVNLLSE